MADFRPRSARSQGRAARHKNIFRRSRSENNFVPLLDGDRARSGHTASSRERLYKLAQRRDIERMTTATRMTEFEVLEDCAGLLDQLEAEKQKQVMAMLATRYGLKITTLSTGSGSGFKPYPKRKAKPF